MSFSIVDPAWRSVIGFGERLNDDTPGGDDLRIGQPGQPTLPANIGNVQLPAASKGGGKGGGQQRQVVIDPTGPADAADTPIGQPGQQARPRFQMGGQGNSPYGQQGLGHVRPGIGEMSWLQPSGSGQWSGETAGFKLLVGDIPAASSLDDVSALMFRSAVMSFGQPSVSLPPALRPADLAPEDPFQRNGATCTRLVDQVSTNSSAKALVDTWSTHVGRPSVDQCFRRNVGRHLVDPWVRRVRAQMFFLGFDAKGRSTKCRPTFLRNYRSTLGRPTFGVKP